MYFQDRTHAAQDLAKALTHYHNKKDTLLIGLPRGGVPIASVVAKRLELPFDILLVRKLGVPGHEEFAMGAIGEGNVIHINKDVVSSLQIPREVIEHVIGIEKKELDRRHQLYRQGMPACKLAGKTVIIVDDGLATGATMHAAIDTLKQQDVKRLVVAVPVGAKSTCNELEEKVDEVICLYAPDPFYGVGNWYNDFSQTTDQEVKELLTLRQKSNFE